MSIGLGLGFTGNSGSASNDILGWLKSAGNLIFFKDFSRSQSTANADFSAGVGTVTITSARSASAPATYFDVNGVMQTTTTPNTPRFTKGFYDETGWHSCSGLLVEATFANLLKYTTNAFSDANWVKTNITVNDAEVATAPATTVSSITATLANATLTQAVTLSAAIRTASIFVKRKTGTGVINFRANTANSYVDVTSSINSTSWTRIQVTSTSLANPTFDLQIVTNGDALYIYGAQLENNPYMTSFVPTTSTLLTRAAEVVTYANLGNRSAASETVFLKFTLQGGGLANDSIYRDFLFTDTKFRIIRKNNNQATLRSYPNLTDSVSSVSLNVTQPQKSVSFMYATAMQNQYASIPYVSSFVNGASDSSDPNNNYTTPAWGSNFTLGQSNSIYESIAIYSKCLQLPDVNHISYILAPTTTYNNYSYNFSAVSNKSGGNPGNTNASSVYEWGCVLEQTSSDTITMITRDGSDAQVAASYQGALWLRTFTISTLTWSAATKIFDSAGSPWQIMWASFRIEGDHLICYINKRRVADTTKGIVTAIESTDLSGSAWGSEIEIIPEHTGNYGVVAKVIRTSDSNVNYNLIITGEASNNWSLYRMTNEGRTLTFSHVILNSVLYNELGFCNYTTNKFILVARLTAGGYLAYAKSTDNVLTITAPTSTGLGFATGTKVTPDISLAAGNSARFMTIFYDRGNNRLVYNNTNAENAFNSNSWETAGYIGTTGGQGNGHFIPYVDSNKFRRYLVVLPKEITATTTNLLWWVIQDDYTWTVV